MRSRRSDDGGLRVSRCLLCISALSVLAVGVVVAPIRAGASTEVYASASTVDPTTRQPFASDVIDEYHKFARRADPLAAKRTVSPPATSCLHQEGIARVNAPDGTPYMFITRSGLDPGFFCETNNHSGTIYIVKMGSRAKNGERMRSNLYPLDNSDLVNRPHIASEEDTTVGKISLDGDHGNFPGYEHPGGMQAVGDLLVVGTENPYLMPAGTSMATVLLINVHNPEDPQTAEYGRIDVHDVGGQDGSDPVALTVVKDADGAKRFLIATAGGPANRILNFYRSPVIETADGDPTRIKPDAALWDGRNWEHVGRFSNAVLNDCLGFDWPIGTGVFANTGQHQMLNFVREGDLDGQLYLFGGRRTGAIVNPWSDERLDLYKVQLTDGLPDACPIAPVANGIRTMSNLSWDERWDTGSFSAASGMYVTPAGEILDYVAPHENFDVILFGEYRSLNIVDNDSPSLRPTATVNGPVVVDEGSSVQISGTGEQAETKAWVSLFQQRGAGESLEPGVWFQVDYADRNELNAGDLDSVMGHEDASTIPLISSDASSLRWWAPPGCNIAATEYPSSYPYQWPGAKTVILRGTGSVEVVRDLSHLPTYTADGDAYPSTPVPDGITPKVVNFEDQIRGISFARPSEGGVVLWHQLCDTYYDGTVGLGWDLDNNGSYETTGNSATFSAATLDGPSQVTAGARAQHPTDTSWLGEGAPISVPVTVRNVAPAVQAKLVDSLGNDLSAGIAFTLPGQPVSLSATFSDPGVADTHTGSVNWGDGTVDTAFASWSDTHNGGGGSLAQNHTFTASGIYNVTTTVTDDDHGATPVTLQIRVMTPEEAIQFLAGQLNGLIAAATDARVKAALIAVRDDLIGNKTGQPPANGAFDKLTAKDPVAAIAKLAAAIGHLAYAESIGAGDLSAMKDMIGMIGEAIAKSAYDTAKALFPTPSKGQKAALQAIADLITAGHAQLLNDQWSMAMDSFKQATGRAVDLRR